MDQVKNRSAADFSQRTDRLAEKLGVALRALPQKIGISERMLFAYRTAENRITAKAWNKLRSAEIAAGIVPQSTQESAGHYRIPSNSAPRNVGVEEQPSAPMLDPRFQPRPNPSTREDIESYFQIYLNAAEATGDPDVFPSIMRQLKKYFPIDEFEQHQKTPL